MFSSIKFPPQQLYSTVVLPAAKKIANLQQSLTLLEWDQHVNISSNSSSSLFAARDASYSLIQQEVFREYHKTDVQRACLFLLSKPRSESLLTEAEYANTRELHRQIFRLTKIPRSVMFRRVHKDQNIDTARVWRECYSRRDWSNPKLLEALTRDFDYASVAGEAMASAEMKNNLLAEPSSSSTATMNPSPQLLTAMDGWLLHQELMLTDARVERIFKELIKFAPYALHMSKQQQQSYQEDEDKLAKIEDRFDGAVLGEEVLLATNNNKQLRSDVENEFCKNLMRDMGFDFERGRVDFSSSSNQLSYFIKSNTVSLSSTDVRVVISKSRLQTQEQTFASLISAASEACGYVLYEQHRPSGEELLDLPASQPRSTALSKAQSLLFERHLLVRPSFMKFLLTRRHQHQNKGSSNSSVSISSSSSFGAGGDVAERLSRRFRQLLRNDKGLLEIETLLKNCASYEIEKGLLLRHNHIEQVPELWRSKCRQYHLVDGDIDGLFYEMQSLESAKDWASSRFGFAPTNVLGSLYASFLFKTMVKQVYGASETALDSDIENGRFDKIKTWLNEKVWSRGSLPLNTNVMVNEIDGADNSSDESLVKCYQEHVFKIMML